jgi:hypothetical protein
MLLYNKAIFFKVIIKVMSQIIFKIVIFTFWIYAYVCNEQKNMEKQTR